MRSASKNMTFKKFLSLWTAARRPSKLNSIAALTLAGFLLNAVAAFGADLSQAVVREKVNVVTLAASMGAAPRPAPQGAVVQNENVVRTGTESRAELEFTDLTLARLGANSIFSFDAQARALNFTQGALLFSKPARSGRVEVRSGAITAAITGSTGFISNHPFAGMKKGRRGAPKITGESTTMLGMLEGKLHGNSGWRDASGREHSVHFSLGPGEMLVAQPGRPPVVVQFDLPRFVKTSPLIKGFSHQLRNLEQLNAAIAEYQSEQRRGFIEPTNVIVTTQPAQLGWMSYNSTPIDAGVDQLRAQSVASSTGSTGSTGDFLDVGSTGLVRAQLVWNTSADLDLHLILPDHQEVFFANPSVTFNNGRATAVLDHDNQGETIDFPPTSRVENIAVNGMPSSGTYTTFVHSFNASPAGSDAFTLTFSGGGQTLRATGTLTDQQNSAPLTIVLPPGI
jgi:hypothetical protein